MRKSILLLIVFLMGLGTMVHAQQDSESTDLVLYQQATKAIKDKKFVFKASLYDDGRKYYNVQPEKNYIVLEDDMVTLACYDASGKLRDIEGKVSKYRLKTDKKGNLHLDISVKTRRNGFSRWNFNIKKGSNHCVVISNPVRKELGFVFIGELLPYDTSGLIAPFILNQLERIDK